ncbi:MAG TPA: CoA transferase [Woeseiaceae bacterium]|nr:CoA transferase [Woeseiaceae bacterium]
MAQALDGVVVADFTHVMAGPFATHLLRLLGARVIKIEEPTRGDALRYYGDDRRYDGMSPAFIAVNAGKESIALDLKDDEQLAIARDIVRNADVLVENFRPGVIGRLGLDYATVRDLNPDLVYCSVSGYGQTDSPYRDWPAIDNIVQATSGMMGLGGQPGDPPVRVGFPVVDTLTGQTAAFAILAALLRREHGGGGEFIDVAMFDATLAFLASAVVPYLVTGKALKRTGNIGYSGQPTSGLFTAGDGRMISLGVVQPRQFAALCRFLERTEWLDDPRFRTPEARRENATELHDQLEAVIRTRPAAEWEAAMSDVGIPCGMVREVGEAAEFRHLGDRALRLPLAIPGLPNGEQVNIVNAGFKMSEDGPGVAAPPPRLDEHRQQVLDWLRAAGTKPASGRGATG